MAVPLLFGLAGCNRQASTETLLQEAQSFYDKGDYRSAVIQLKNALQNSPDDAEIRYRLGVAYNRTGDGVSAEKELKKALELKSDHPKAAMELGGSLLRRGESRRRAGIARPGPCGITAI